MSGPTKLCLALALIIIMADAYEGRLAAERAEIHVRNLQCPAPVVQHDTSDVPPHRRAARVLM